MAQSDDDPAHDPDTAADEAPRPLPDQAQRFGDHWLRMSAVLLSELKRRDLMDTPEAQAVVGTRRQIIRKHRAQSEAAGGARRKRRPETKWEAFLRKVGRKPRSGSGSRG
ncbi:hypothetical protein C882_3878 [Caenispirillum salinarum AK4]|uniref:Uncharacterized protein n=1 Tax=Caenispirillum salinarum AK4 TaxID=1238182 RepID=K9GZU9_9PROT|nr:hypothetical protein [Caenispirillum salinarum]EKV31505.1 hypothetical protein C882_3878 [Caenispirillum salinarum AK4]